MIENKLERLKISLEAIVKNASVSKRQYINSLLEEIIFYINKNEMVIKKLLAKKSGYDNYGDYETNLDKAIALLCFFGMSEVEFNTMRKDILTWMFYNTNELKRKATWNDVVRIYKIADHFLTFNDRMPEDFKELKIYWEELQHD